MKKLNNRIPTILFVLALVWFGFALAGGVLYIFSRFDWLILVFILVFFLYGCVFLLTALLRSRVKPGPNSYKWSYAAAIACILGVIYNTLFAFLINSHPDFVGDALLLIVAAGTFYEGRKLHKEKGQK